MFYLLRQLTRRETGRSVCSPSLLSSLSRRTRAEGKVTGVRRQKFRTGGIKIKFLYQLMIF